MASILIAAFHQQGHLAPTFGFARSLVERGHEVRYLVYADQARLVADRGFQPVICAESVFPEGSFGQVLPIREVIARQQKIFQFIFDDGIDEAMSRHSPDLCLVNQLRPEVTLTAMKLGIRTALFNPSFPSAVDLTVPPYTGHLLPSARLRTRLAWGKHALVSAFNQLIYPQRRFIHRLAARIGYPRDRILHHTLHGIGLRAPEIVLAPEALDFPRQQRAGHSYMGLMIDDERPDQAFPWERVNPKRRLIYAAFGTRAFREPSLHRFVSVIVEAVSRRSDWQLVLACGPHADRVEPRPNALLLRSAPQLELLARANLFITHGGLSSIKEAILRAVPMIVAPLTFDQPGNAARVAHHGLGERVDTRRENVERLAARIDRVLTDAAYKHRVTALRDHSLGEEPASKVVEHILALTRAPIESFS